MVKKLEERDHKLAIMLQEMFDARLPAPATSAPPQPVLESAPTSDHVDESSIPSAQDLLSKVDSWRSGDNQPQPKASTPARAKAREVLFSDLSEIGESVGEDPLQGLQPDLLQEGQSGFDWDLA